MSWLKKIILLFSLAGLTLAGLASCSNLPDPDTAMREQGVPEVSDLMIVDCLLPGRIQRVGSLMVYQSARTPAKTTAIDCRTRGGEYTAIDRANITTALRVWLGAAQQGDANAQAYVGEIYEKGLGELPNYELAAYWYQKAALQDNARAQTNLAHLYEQGLGVAQDRVAALNWYRKASGLQEHLQYASTLQTVSALTAEQQKLKDHYVLQLSILRKEIANLQKQLQSGQATEQETRSLQSELAFTRSAYQSMDEQLRRQASEQPVISIIDPPMVATRSGKPAVLLDQGVSYQKLIGRINTQVDLKSLTMNGQPVRLDKHNAFFWVHVPVNAETTQVEIVATNVQGRQDALHFSLIREKKIAGQAGDTGMPGMPGMPDLFKSGRSHALVIGNSQYQHFTPLATAEADARAIAQVLQKKYAYETKLLLDADSAEILTALNELRETLKETDRLFIYYAGHGELQAEQGYWLGVDAKPDESSTWLSNEKISDLLNVLSASQILVAADSCYAGALSGTSIARLDFGLPMTEKKQWLATLSHRKARTLLTSGGLSPVPDTHANGHSVFASALVQVLSENNSLLEGYGLYRRLLEALRGKPLHQMPEYGAIAHTGHTAGEYFLMPRPDQG